MTMIKASFTVFGLATLVAASGCGASHAESNRAPASSADAYADPERSTYTPAEPGAPLAPISDPATAANSPYQVELWYGDSGRLPTFSSGGKAYVLGTIGERYRIHIANPTSRRVEAVVSVDGLDAIDGRTASFEDKRGYVIAPYADVTVDGFRTSADQVATFRFSSVRDSYAGRKGQDRNVGVIGVAFFPERELPMQAVPPPAQSYDDRPRSSGGPMPPRKAAPADAEASSRAPAAPSAAPESKGDAAGAYGGSARREVRRGIGTEFGEQRYSNVGYTSFQRESSVQPAHIVELRYNDRQGLLALGIPVDRALGRESEVSRRETADPFPRSRYATPPPR
jgi:hypothetical protein